MGAYVKVFAGAAGGAPKFYKDGYTDCLGTFDYASLNAKRSPLGSGGHLAVLLVTRESGAMVQVVPAPPLVREDLSKAEPDFAGAAPELPLPEPCGRNANADSFSGSSEGEEEGYGDEF
uniref:Uncharacterized protein n=1 Tax=Pyrodinium bahamense TaxID=73915 RepID=A0A7R9ZWF7_9DINO|mmetsp:Transcript_12707/g.35137  ORF Transcript_12707/g.35137 Transcript_12707/m.35137 type:complete len:119 (+) Transcript_12707:1-357(+)